MISILSFDTASMKHLLDDKFQEYFEIDYPIFFISKFEKENKTKTMKKYFYRSAIDLAFKNNQLRAVKLINDYIVKY